MSSTWLRAIGLVLSAVYAVFIVWLYAAQPRTLAEVRGGVAAGIGTYAIDKLSFEAGLAFFRKDQFEEARTAFARADPAQRDATTQFYVAYAYLRQGWGRLYHDDAVYEQGRAALARAVAAAPGGSVRVEDPNLTLHTSDELAAELERGVTRTASDFNPMRLWRSRP